MLNIDVKFSGNQQRRARGAVFARRKNENPKKGSTRRHALFNGGGIPMKRALGVVVFAALKARNVAFPKSGKSIFKSIFISVWLGKFFKFSKLCSAVELLFLRHIGCGANALIFGVAPLKKIALLNRIISAFQHCALHSYKNSAQVKRLETEGYYA